MKQLASDIAAFVSGVIARRSFVRPLAALAVAAVAIAGLLVARAAVTEGPLERLVQRDGERQSTRVWEGSWYFPRGGPYVLGFDSPRGRATLTIDGRPRVIGAGLRHKRIVYQAGTKAVRFEAPPGARLLWHPPGRRGPLEYVPTSSLSPDAPDQATFSTWVGASPWDGLFAGVILAILIGLVVYLVRPLFPRLDRTTALWALAILGGALAVRLYDLGGAGQTWDEDVNWSAGRNYITNWLNLDFAPASWQWNMEHPPVMKYVAGIGAQWADGYGPARALSALMVAFACALLVPIGRRLGGLRVGVMAGAIAALTPHLIAHGKIVGHEAPTALLWALTIWLCLMAHDPTGRELEPAKQPDNQPDRLSYFEDPLFWRMLVISLALGLAIYSRFVNVLLAPLCGVILLVMAPPGKRLRTVVMGLTILAPAALLVGLIIWPRLWVTPIAHMQEAWAKLSKPHALEPFLDTITNEPPPYYFVVYLAATAPLGILVAAFVWVFKVVRQAVRRERRELVTTLVVCAWLAAPLIVMFSPVRQDGVRYVIPSLLCLALMAAGGLDFALAGLGRLHAALASARAATIAGAVLVLYMGVTAARIHPYYLDYYGEHVGGPSGVAADRLFEIAWYGEGIADAIDHVNKRAKPGARVHKRCVEPSHLTWLRGDLWATEARRPEHADWILAYQPSWKRCPIPAGMQLVHEVRAQGAPLIRVYRRVQ